MGITYKLFFGANTLLAYGRMSFQRQIAYRTANLAGLFTNVFFLLFRGFALGACFAGREEIGGLTQSQTLTYTTVSQALLMVIPQWGRAEVANEVRSGQIAMDLCRPISFPAMFFARRLGGSFAFVFLRFPGVMLAGLALGFLSAPECSWGLLVVSIVLGALICHSIILLVELSAFWMESERGVRYFVLGLSAVLSGLIMPLHFYPEWILAISKWLPFEHGLYTPVRLYIGEVESVREALTMQAGWALVMISLSFFLFWLGTRKLTIQGG